MLKVSKPKKGSNVDVDILSCDWTKTSPRQIKFEQFAIHDVDNTYFYVVMGKLINCKEAHYWKPNEDPNKMGRWEDIDEFTSPAVLRFQKAETTFKNKDGTTNTVKPTAWDDFFIGIFKELAANYPDGKVSITLNMTESNLGMAERYKVETNPDKKAAFLDFFCEVKPLPDDYVLSEVNLNEVIGKTANNSGTSGKNYVPKETMAQVLDARYDFVIKHLSLALGESENNPMPLDVYMAAIELESDAKKRILERCLDVLLKLATGVNS